MDGQIPITIKPKEKKKGGGLRVFLISAIVFLLLFNVSAGYLYFTGKRYFNDFAQSAKTATQNSNRWGVLADIGLSAQDVAGEEIPGIVRFPESVRTYYSNSNNLIIAEYQAAETKEVVGNYFKAYLANYGWLLVEMSPDKVIYTKDDKEINITLTQNLQITTYHIEYK